MCGSKDLSMNNIYSN